MAAVLAAVFAGPAAMALWSAQVTVSGQVTAAQVTSSVGLAPQTATIANEALSRASLVTITNTTTGSSPVAAQVRADLSVDSVLNPGILVTAWPVQTPAECTDTAVAPPGSATGPWTDGLSVQGDPVVPGAESYLCVQTTGTTSAFGIDGGTQSFSPTITTTLSVHGFAATATTVATYTTQWIFRVFTWSNGRVHQIRPDSDRTLCLDAGAAMGMPVTLAACQGTVATPGPNQFFIWTTVAPNYQTLTAGRAAGGLVTIDPDQSLRTRAAGVGEQTWQLQRRTGSGTAFQVVSGNGLCWTAPAVAGGPMTAAVCDGSTAQQWAFLLVSEGTTGNPEGGG
ncbi:RICIN domain-containing protein [Leifsonia sp. TF02-11]|uniref:RICIN domain-containing protein n=1 Tax=Leifsonia sp. TF02-11 TaxID=2815212 RepID=UPI001AA19EB7|nr:RICIN domain-containing protein [Leifsonia sp. TF02-11]MBO1741752.1 ricin-type beta-trefoil lectin domain protein [Leifsonia sp. TF02-11]